MGRVLAILQGSAAIPGSCGELVQGTIGGTNFLVSCPVNWYSYVRVRIGPSLEDDFPQNRLKTYQAVRKMLNIYDYPGYGAVLEVDSSIPMGKGMASSTADMAAGCFAVAAALKVAPDPHKIAAITLSIEPSDAVSFPGIVLFDHIQGRLYEELGSPLPLGIIALDFGGAVDTMEFNRRDDLRLWNSLNECEVGQALELVKAGISGKDPVLLGRGATLSALVNQRILPKPCLEELIDFTSKHGVYGVNAAHSGTVVGVLVPLGMEVEHSFVSAILKQFPEVKFCCSLRLVGGGPHRQASIWRKDDGYGTETPAWW